MNDDADKKQCLATKEAISREMPHNRQAFPGILELHKSHDQKCGGCLPADAGAQ